MKFHHWVISCFECNSIKGYNNEWNSWCLLAGDKFMPEMHLKKAWI